MCGCDVRHWQVTSTSSTWDKCSALACLMEFPALVTNTTGTLYFPLLSTRFRKHCLAAGMGVLPRTSTPSMSKRSPKELGFWGETWATEEGALSSGKIQAPSLTHTWLSSTVAPAQSGRKCSICVMLLIDGDVHARTHTWTINGQRALCEWLH